jgi:hypothetical protein
VATLEITLLQVSTWCAGCLPGALFYCIYRQFKPVGFGDKFKRGYAQELRRGFFIDEEPVGILPAEPSSTA